LKLELQDLKMSTASQS